MEAWSIKGANNRLQRRLSSTEAERVAFFDAGRGLLGPALAYLDRKPLQELDEPEERLMRLMLSFAHVALAVEVQGDDEPKHARDARYLTITRAPADQSP